MTGVDTALTVLGLVVIGLVGLAVGSFLNVVIWRVPRGQSVNRPPSACPSCGRAIRARDNVPIVSWLVLRGRCRDCSTSISARYPLVEGATAASFLLLALRFGFTSPGVWALPAFFYLAAIAIALTLIDLDSHRLPNAIVLPSYGIGLVLLAIATAASGEWFALLRAVIGAISLFTFYLVLAVVVPRGMGFGDVKLAGVLGLFLGWLGWDALLVGAFAAFVLGGLFSIALLALRKAGRRSGIPFGPWMLAGAGVGVFFGEELADSYLAVVGLN